MKLKNDLADVNNKAKTNQYGVKELKEKIKKTDDNFEQLNSKYDKLENKIDNLFEDKIK